MKKTIVNKIYAYLRISADNQFEREDGLTTQLKHCQIWAEDKGYSIEKVFEDRGVSGSTGLDKRPSLLEAISLLKKGDILLISRRYCLTHDFIEMDKIEAAINCKKARIISTMGEGTENDDPSSILMRRMIDIFGEYENR